MQRMLSTRRRMYYMYISSAKKVSCIAFGISEVVSGTVIWGEKQIANTNAVLARHVKTSRCVHNVSAEIHREDQDVPALLEKRWR